MSQQGQEIRLADEEILGQVLGQSRGFYPGRGRQFFGSSSSFGSIGSHGPEPSLYRMAFASYAAASQQQTSQLYEHLHNDNNTPYHGSPFSTRVSLSMRMKMLPTRQMLSSSQVSRQKILSLLGWFSNVL